MKESGIGHKMTSFLGENLKLLRKTSNLTQANLAKELNISRSRIAAYESQSVEPSAQTALQIAEYFDTPIEILLSTSLAEAFQNDLVIEGSSKSLTSTDLLKDLIGITSQVTKIVEGYEILLNRRLAQVDSAQERGALQDQLQIMSILRELVDINWQFIHATLPGYDQEE